MPQVSYLGLFPFCYTETNDSSLVGSGTLYPVGFNLQEFCYFYWKVDGYHATGKLVDTGDPTNIDKCLGLYPDDPYYFPITQGYFRPTNELDLVCNWTADHFLEYSSSSPILGIISFAGSFDGVPNVYFYDNKYWPWLFIETESFYSGAYTPLVSPSQTCTFLSKAIDLFSKYPDNPPMTDFSLNITACQEWPYNP
jgi:hypothetical protein